MTMEKLVSRAVIIWMLIIMITISGLYNHMNETGAKYYRFGPHDDFIIIGIPINTGGKYFIAVLYCFINSLIRNTIHNILNPWLINNVQNINIVKPKQISGFAYEVTYVVTIYNWVDWYVYMNLLLAQVDLFLTEMFADVLMSSLTTYYYLNTEAKNQNNEIEDDPITVTNPMFLDEEIEIEINDI
jgi:hypothetical protein